MRVVILGTRGFPNVQGGAEKHTEQLSVNLVRIGCKVIAFRRKPYVDPTLKEYQGIQLVTLPTVKAKALETILHTFIGVFAAMKYKPDVLHFQAIGSALFIPLARLLGFRVVLTTHGSNYKHQKWGRLAKLVFMAGEYLGMRFAHQVIAVSRTIAKEMDEKYKRRPVVIPNGVNFTVPQSPGSSSPETIKKYDLEKGNYIITVGRFVKGKGFEDLIEAFARTQDTKHKTQTESWKLVIVGDADHEDEYSVSVKRKAKSVKGVVLTGKLTTKPLSELYEHAGLFVLPSYYEGLSMVLLEAMSYGLSCIVSDIPANREVQLDDERYFAPGDIETMTEKMREFIQNPLTEEESQSQIEYIRKNFNWEKIAKETIKVYKEL